MHGFRDPEVPLPEETDGGPDWTVGRYDPEGMRAELNNLRVEFDGLLKRLNSREAVLASKVERIGRAIKGEALIRREQFRAQDKRYVALRDHCDNTINELGAAVFEDRSELDKRLKDVDDTLCSFANHIRDRVATLEEKPEPGDAPETTLDAADARFLRLIAWSEFRHRGFTRKAIERIADEIENLTGGVSE
jgi:hypothetical protein